MSESPASIQIPPDVSEALERAAKQRRVTEAEVIVDALRYYLGIINQDAIDRACREINEADRQDPELQAVMEQVYLENMFE
jgi:predicted transcriptional regulator